MNWVTMIWSALVAVSLTLGVQHLLVWYRMRSSWAHLFSTLMSVGTASLATCELLMMRANTPEAYAVTLRWVHVSALLIVVAVVGFVRTHLRAGRPWLGWTACILRGISLVVNFLEGDNLNFMEVVRLRPVSFLGESVSVGEGVVNPWTTLGMFSLAVLTVFTVDAVIAVWRRGDRKTALWVGGSILVFGLFTIAQVPLVFTHHVDLPMIPSVASAGVLSVMAVSLSWDVLHAARLSKDLRASEARFRGIFEGAREGIFRTSPSGEALLANPALARMLGYDSGEDVVHGVGDAGQQVWANPEERARFVHLVETQDAVSGYESWFKRKDGTRIWVSLSSRAIRGPDGRVVCFEGFAQDITARKEAELELEQQRNELSHMARVSMMGLLASSLAHELNQPLGAIMRNAEAAELFLEDPSPDLEELRIILSDIRKDDARAAAVIDRVRSLLKRRGVEYQALDVAPLVKDVIGLVLPDANRHLVRLALQTESDLPPVRGDRVQLQQVLLNLLINAMDAVKGNPPADRRVSLRARAALASVEIDVIDNGHGIPADMLPRIFEPFRSSKSDGLGMGLPISLAIIEAHGGRLWAENQDGDGARFTFSLPAATGGGAM